MGYPPQGPPLYRAPDVSEHLGLVNFKGNEGKEQDRRNEYLSSGSKAERHGFSLEPPTGDVGAGSLPWAAA